MLFEHQLRVHRETGMKLSEMLNNALLSTETVYSSDSDCEYELEIEVYRRQISKKEFSENLVLTNTQEKPLEMVDTRLPVLLKKRSEMKIDCDDLRSIEKVLIGPDGRLQCPKCTRTFAGRKNLRQHIKIYHIAEVGFVEYDLEANSKLICPECQKELLTPRNLRKHLKLCHNKIVKFMNVEKYGKVLGGLRYRNVDFFDSPRVVQNDLAKDFPIVRERSPESSRPKFRCGICDYGPFYFSRAIKRHQAKDHGREPLKMDLKQDIFKCNMCPKEFWSKDNLSRHMKLHSNIKNYVCTYCGLAFKTSAVLRKHKMAHVLIKCLLCESEFTLRSEYKNHHLTFHRHKDKAFDITELDLFTPKKNLAHIPKKIEKPIVCEKCSRVFAAMSGYKVHKCVDPASQLTKKKKPEEETECPDCNRKYKSFKSFKDHNCPKSDNPYQAICELCDKEFKTKKGFDMHRCKELPGDKLGDLIKNKL